MLQDFNFPEMRLSDSLVRDLHRLNPWWTGRPLPPLPQTRRHLVRNMRLRLQTRLAPIVVVRGPRQIGKTTAQLQVLEDLLSEGAPPQTIFRVQCDELSELTQLDEPILRLVDWYESAILGWKLNEAARAKLRTYLFFDEVQNVKNWAPQLKFLVDTSSTQVVVTGSSALRIELGRDSLAGRITTIEAGLLSLTEIAQFYGKSLGKPFLEDNGLEPLTRKEFWQDLAAHGRHVATVRDDIFSRFSAAGGYPLVHESHEIPWSQLADQLNETVIRRVIEHDLRVGDRGRKRDAPLLEEVFRLACRYIGQAPGRAMMAREAQRALGANVGEQRIGHYLRFLGDTLLLRLIEPLEIRLKKKRGNLKICLADHGLRASWLQEVIPLSPEELSANPHLSGLAGHIAESVVGATLSTIGSLDLAHLPERDGEPEVDFILTIGTKRIPLEVKYQRKLDPLRDTEGLRTFIEKAVNNAPFGVVVTQDDGSGVDDPRIVTLPLSSLMLLR
ncbi:MAG: AAA family ATPase [Candidatus Hydrogenedentes bacterium]|nr:AAA family ATPase [Candidatus Hydrogenedentota bacterium]